MVHCPLLLVTATLTRGRKERIGKGKRRGCTAGALYSPEFYIKVLFDNNFTDENTISFLHCEKEKRMLQEKGGEKYCEMTKM